jgi:N,N'-diacetyllegionaminate synthase
MHFFVKNSVYIIAEIGVNHNGDLRMAENLIIAAKQAGADAVKFQTFAADRLALHSTKKCKYQERDTKSKSHYEMLKRLELSSTEHIQLSNFCREMKIDFISTPYDIESARFLLSIDICCFKVASADIVDHPLHKFIASTKKPVIISTGMSTLEEIKDVVNIYRDHKSEDIVLLHGVSNYPCSDGSLNMRSMQTIKNIFDIPVGFTDHSIGETAAIISVALGGVVIEKHLTLDKSLEGPDHLASSDPLEFKNYVKQIRQSEIALGSAFKQPQQEEMDMLEVSRKSIVLCVPKKKGTVVLQKDLVCKRPGIGITPNFIDDVVGKVMLRNCDENHILQWSDLI